MSPGLGADLNVVNLVSTRREIFEETFDVPAGKSVGPTRSAKDIVTFVDCEGAALTVSACPVAVVDDVQVAGVLLVGVCVGGNADETPSRCSS